MLEKSFARIEAAVIDRPWRVLSVALTLTLVAGWLGLGLDLRNSRRELVPEGDLNQARWDAVRADFADPEPLIIAIERESARIPVAAAELAAERIATQMSADPLVSSVFYRVDIKWIGDHVLHLADPADLQATVAQLNAALTDGSGEILLSNFADLNERLARRIEGSLGEGTVVPTGAETEAARLADFLAAQADFLAAPHAWVAQVASDPVGLLDPATRGSITPNGFLATDEGDVLFVLVHPAGDSHGGLERFQAIVARARTVSAEITAGIAGVHFGLTGPPAMEVEEMASIGRDGWRTSAIAIVGVFLLSLLAFHRRFHAVIGLVTLAVGVICAIGAVQLEFGYLNLITTSLIPILIGMGIDYAVHPISQYEIERRVLPRRAAVRATFRKTGRPVVVSALTTSVAFFCFLLMRFRGFSELGLVTGIGVLLCLAAALFALPALLAVAGRGHREDRGVAVDKIWDEGAAATICRAPRATVMVAAAVTLAALPALWQVRVNPNVLDLLPIGAESLRYLEVMNERSALRNDFNLVVAENLTELREIQARAAAHSEIERFDSLLTFLPADAAAAQAAASEAGALLDRVAIGNNFSTSARLERSLARLETALADASEAAFLTGSGELAAALEAARSSAAGLVTQVNEAGSVEREAWARGESILQDRARALLSRLRVAAAAPVPTPETLPPDLASRFVTTHGTYVGYLYPSGSIYDAEFLRRFNAVSHTVSSSAIGFPVLFGDHSNLITAGFGMALGVGAILVALLLLADLRSIADTLLALVPVALGLIWLLGLVTALGIELNFANLIAIPIVLGVGIDAGVHLVHRWRLERDGGMIIALAHTGRAILVASLTTMIGFGSLTFATHRGMASLGLMLFIGVGGCLVAAVVVLPNLLLTLGRAQR
jgi:predicted RND superfamily exporter protein